MLHSYMLRCATPLVLKRVWRQGTHVVYIGQGKQQNGVQHLHYLITRHYGQHYGQK